MAAPELQSSPVSMRTFKRGEVVLAQGARPTHMLLIRSGLISVCILKDEPIQLYFVGPNECLGEEALNVGTGFGASAIALRDTEVLEIPLETVQEFLKATPPLLNSMLRGVIERLKFSLNELRSFKSATQARPCPSDHTAKAFGVVFHTARYLGAKTQDGTVVDWSRLKDHACGVLDEDPVRLEEVIHILEKLGYAEPLQQGVRCPRPIPPSEKWSQICFRNMEQIEAFFDFYQNYQFKSGRAALLKTNEKATKVTQALLKVADRYQVDRSGMVTMPYKATVDAMKELLGKTFDADQIFRLEQKGLMVKRVSTADGGLLSFWKAEFEQMLLNWKVLREVELWNEHGFVELAANPDQDLALKGAAPAEKPSQEASFDDSENWKPLVLSGGAPVLRTEMPRPNEPHCPLCLSTTTPAQKYCSVCDSAIRKKED